MPYEVYSKNGFGRRLRKITAAQAASLRKLGPGLYTSIPELGYKAPQNVAPTKTRDPVITGNTAAGDTLTCTPGAYTGTPTPTVTRQWKAGATNIAGATGLTYVIAAVDTGKSITCVETATNAAGTVTGTSNAIAAA